MSALPENREVIQSVTGGGVFGVDEVKSVSVMEGDSFTLSPNTNDADMLRENLIMWRFGNNNNNSLIAKFNRKDNTTECPDKRFRDRLTLDQTGSLSITNTRTTDSGLYRVLGTSTETPLSIFNLTVYAHLPVPLISRDCSSSSSSSQQNCSLLCSVVNVGHVTLSWYKGNSLLSSISVSDLSINLSLPLEVEYQDNNTYSCVLNNPIRNQTTHLDITQLCHTCSDQHFLYIVLISAAAGSLLIVVAIMIFWFYRKTDQEVCSSEEITYADPTFYKRKAQKSRVQEEEDVVYAGVAMRH
ncbi:hepatic and glial cell adhesion molecule-like [Onychostoma macrolepis]|uniref:hepatic and glial cell adhesion molecule-like n=1 Tax=Onychostoma macrolepis TaxID=369639 RepID=UPI00272D7B7F|nr:hepatic and glial cell adhesion molecule-like [Onychostoma macrolepis]